MNGVQEEEAEEIIAIANSFNNVAGSDHDEHRELWCVLGREDLSVWYLRVAFQAILYIVLPFQRTDEPYATTAESGDS